MILANLFFAVSILLFVTAGFAVLLNIILGMRLYFYLLNNKPQRLEEITYIPYFGGGGSNPFRWLPYIYNELDTEDAIIKSYKKKIRQAIKYGLITIGVLILLEFLLISLAVMLKASGTIK